MVKGHKIKKRVDVLDFIKIIEGFGEKDIITTRHTLFRLKEADRKVFKDTIIKEYILKQNPIYVGVQFNGAYAVFYEYGNDVLKVLLDIQADNIYVITFYITSKENIPRI